MNNPYFTPKQIEKKPMSRYVRTKETGDKVYLIEGENYHWIKSAEVYAELGGAFGKEQMVEYKDLRAYKQAVPIDMNNAFEYKLVEEEKKEETEEKPPEKFTTYEEEEVSSAPKVEPVKGFTSIIIPAYLKDYSLFHHTGNCIGSIREHTDKTATPYEIILILNGPTAVKFDNFSNTYADKIIEIPENVGYAKAVNRGIRVAKGEYIVVMNNDVQVFDHWLQDFQDGLESKDLVMATPMYGKPWARAIESKELRENNFKGNSGNVFDTFRDFSCIATRKSLFDEIGLFDEEFFCYKEDLDFMNRMDAAGKKYASTKMVNTFHIIGATSIQMKPEELHKEEGTKYYESKYPKI